jgi:hypothetical protein
MIFGGAEAVRRDIRENRMSPADLIRGRKWEGALKVLDERHGLSEWQVDLIRTAESAKLISSKNGKWINGFKLYKDVDPLWPDAHTNDIVTLLQKKLVFIFENQYYLLTEQGVELRNNLQACYVVQKSKNLATVMPNSEKEIVDYYTDVDLSRDGLITTLGKMWWVAVNRQMVKDVRLQDQITEYQKNQGEMEKKLQLIQTSEQRVARELEEQGPLKITNSLWTVEQQRQQNDLYWMNPEAFFLNPNGPLAEPLPAPEWWSPPVNYQPAAMRHLRQLEADDIVAQSLLAPPKKEEKVVDPFDDFEEWEADDDDDDDIDAIAKLAGIDPLPKSRKSFKVIKATWDDIYHSVSFHFESILYEEIDVTFSLKDLYISNEDEMEVTMILENEFKASIPDLFAFNTIKDLVDYICRQNGIPCPDDKVKAFETKQFVMVEVDNTVAGFNSAEEAEQFLLKRKTEQARANKVADWTSKITAEKINDNKLNGIHRAIIFNRVNK